MSATVDRPARPHVRLAAAACLVLISIGPAEPSLASSRDAGAQAEAASQASCDARHSDSGCSHPDHADESEIPVVEAPEGLGPPRRLRSRSSDSGTALPQSPPVRPPSI